MSNGAMRSIGWATFFLVAIASAGGCGRLGYDVVNTPALSLDESRIVNALPSATFMGSCTSAFEVQVTPGGSVACEAGRFQFATPSETTDGTRLYRFVQQDGAGHESAASGTWVRDTTAPSLTLDDESIENSLDSATFTGDCSSSAGAFTVTTSLTTTMLTCNGGRFSFTTPQETSDGTRDYVFTLTNAAGQEATATGSWTRNSALPLLRLDESFLSSGTDSVTFTGDCPDSSNPIVVTETDSGRSVGCDAGRFSYRTVSRLDDGIYTITFSQADDNGAGVSAEVTGRWQRATQATPLSTVGIPAASLFGDAVAVVDDMIFVGAPADDTAATGAGAVYQYLLTDGGYGDPVRLLAPVPAENAQFGEAFAHCDNLLLVGADCGNVVECDPAVYVYELDPDGVSLNVVQQLRGQRGSKFGNRIACDGQTLVIGAQNESEGSADIAGAIYVYERSTGPTWDNEERLTASTPGVRFGLRVAVAGDWIVVTRRLGAATAFRREAGAWIDRSGTSEQFNQDARRFVVLSGSELFIGYFSLVRGWTEGPAGWVFNNQIGGANGEQFGEQGAFDGGQLLVAAPSAGSNAEGAVNRYRSAPPLLTFVDSTPGPAPDTRLAASSLAIAGDLVAASNEERSEVFFFRLPAP